jgi:hypothetical protein
LPPAAPLSAARLFIRACPTHGPTTMHTALPRLVLLVLPLLDCGAAAGNYPTAEEAAAATASGSTAAAAAVPRPKHLLMTVIDDLGFDDFGYTNGNQIKTPTFNAMRAGGIGFTQYYVQPSCSPTRATILTGRKPVHTGINYWIPNAAYGLPLNETTFAQVMNARGYKSHAVGKVGAVDSRQQRFPRCGPLTMPTLAHVMQWHLGCHKSAYLPTFRGFDSFYGYVSEFHPTWSRHVLLPDERERQLALQSCGW